VVVGSPQCTTFSNLQNLSKGRSDPIERQRKFTEGMVLLNFALDVYCWQLSRGRYFAREHPATATSWKLPEAQGLMKDHRVEVIVNDDCVFGTRFADRRLRGTSDQFHEVDDERALPGPAQ
jgi:hypothetical protein